MFRGMKHFAGESEPSGGGAAPAAIATPTAATVATAATTPAAAPESDPNWLTPRLERERASARKAERASLLKEIGVSDPAAAAKLVAEEAKRVEAAKSLELRATESEKALAAERERVAALSGTVTAIAAERMTGLTEAQRAAVTAIAGEDPAAQLKAIGALAPTWSTPAQGAAAAAATTATAAATSAAAAPAAAATTAPGQTAPAGTTTTSQPDHKAEYKRLKAENPVQAAAYLNTHAEKIYPRA